MSVIKSSFPNNFFGFYDGMTSEYAPGLLKYDVCMTEQVSGPQRTKIAGRHMVMIPYPWQASYLFNSVGFIVIGIA